MLDQVPILLAEDDGNYVALIGRALLQAAIPNPFLVVKSGRDAIDYLAGMHAYADREKYPVPGLLLLDLKMPWMDGFDVLSWLRQQPHYDSLPVIVLTSSRLQSDIDQSRLLGVYDYRVKPHDFADLVELLSDVRKRWLSGPNHIVGALEGGESDEPSDSGRGLSGPV